MRRHKFTQLLLVDRQIKQLHASFASEVTPLVLSIYTTH